MVSGTGGCLRVSCWLFEPRCERKETPGWFLDKCFVFCFLAALHGMWDIPRPGIESVASAVEGSLNHSTAKEVQKNLFLRNFSVEGNDY